MARLFRPEEYVPDYQRALDVEHVEGIWTHPKLPGSELGYVEDTIIVEITGKVSDAGGAIHGAAGRWFGPGNIWSQSIRCNKPDMSDQWINMLAAISVLNDIGLIREPCPVGCEHFINRIRASDLKCLVIKTDSDFLAETMTRGGITWLIRNGFTLSSGEPLHDLECIAEASSMMEALEGEGVETLFWHVEKEDIIMAHDLADEAYQEEGCC